MADIYALISPLINVALSLVARTRLPRTKGDMKLPGIHEIVEIFRDQWGIPHIYAQNLEDLFFAQGFAHAQDRLWQMEFNRRMVAGRLSEVLGSVTLNLDRWLRILTMRRIAEFEVQLLNDETRNYLQAYANGVNSFIGSCRPPIEFVLLGYRPEAWVIADTLAWIKMMSWSLSVNWENEILHARLIDKLGPE
jgi:penicillin amidase